MLGHSSLSLRSAGRGTPTHVRPRALAHALAGALLLAASQAHADRVALLPSRGGIDPSAQRYLDVDIARGLSSLGHTVVPDIETNVALAAVPDGVADTPAEYRDIAVRTNAHWVLVGKVEPAVKTRNVELTAYLSSLARVESVAREVNDDAAPQQVREMLAVLVRPEGIGMGALPWEQAAPPPHEPRPQVAAPPPLVPEQQPPPLPIAGPPPQEPWVSPLAGKKIVSMDYAFDRHDVWPPYSTGRRAFAGGFQGFSAAAVRPSGAKGSTGAIVAAARGGYAPGERGLEFFGQIAGNLVGPRALWLDVGARWMFTPSVHPGGDGVLRGLAFHVGPELLFGGFFRFTGDAKGPGGVTYEGRTEVDPSLGLALAMALSFSPSLQIETQLVNMRWVPSGDDTLLLFGATIGAALRF